MTQGRSYVAGLLTGVVVTGAIGFVGLRATAAPRAANAAETTQAAPIAAAAQDAMPKPAVKVLLENAQVRVRKIGRASCRERVYHPV